jgi:uncharacterized YccA/Bax inhibitor family protein
MLRKNRRAGFSNILSLFFDLGCGSPMRRRNLIFGFWRIFSLFCVGVLRIGIRDYCGHMKKKTNRESARIPQAFGLLSESDLLILTFASLLCSLAHPSSGAFGQILSPPQRLL